MIHAFVTRMLEQGTFRRASHLPPDKRVQFLRRASAMFAFFAGFALADALCGVVLCVYMCRSYFSSRAVPSLSFADRFLVYAVFFAALSLFFVFLAVLSATARRVLRSSVA